MIAPTGRVGQRRAADPREERNREDVRMAEPAAEPADELRCEAKQHLGQRSAGHQFRGEDEKRHRHQCEHIDAGEQIFRQRDQRQMAVHDRRKRRPAQAERHRHAEDQQRHTGGE